MAIVRIADDTKDVTVWISIKTGGTWEYDYEHHTTTRCPGAGVPMPTASFPHKYCLGAHNIGKSDYWTFRITSLADRDIDYELHIEWWQDQKLMEEWDMSGTIGKGKPVQVIQDEAKFRSATVHAGQAA